MRERMLGNIAESGLRGEDDFGDRDEGRRPPPREEQKQFKPNRNRDEDDDLKRAIEESKRVQDDDDARRRARNQELVSTRLSCLYSVLPRFA
jgi:epsin